MERLALNMLLCDVLECPELGPESRVYFQPGPSTKMHYPAIVYSLNDIPMTHADNMPYRIDPEYMLTLIDRNPDSEYLIKLMKLPKIDFNRAYSADNLHHWAFTIY